jgi:hypothetical protein
LPSINSRDRRCARELGVDKSVISRWARVTAKLQQSHPRFQTKIWRLDLNAFAASLQSDDPRGAGRRTALMLGTGLPFLRGEFELAAAAAVEPIAAHPS